MRIRVSASDKKRNFLKNKERKKELGFLGFALCGFGSYRQIKGTEGNSQ